MSLTSPDDALIPRRPLGVWVLALSVFILTTLWVLSSAPWYLFPPRHAQLPPNIFGWLLLLTNIVMLGSAYGLWMGSKSGRNIFLGCWVFLTGVMFTSMVTEIDAMRANWPEQITTDYIALSIAQTTGIFLSWIAVLIWYFRRSHTREFFEYRSACGCWYATKGMTITALVPTVLIFGGIETVYRTTGAPSHPPIMLAEQLKVSPGSELSADEKFSQFIQVRQGSNPWEAEASQKFTALLQERFPKGTSETALASALRQQGFVSPPVTGVECTPEGETPKPGSNLSTCHYDYNPEKTLKYRWWRFAGWQRDKCLEEVHVHWSADSLNAVTDIKGEYMKVCGFILEPRHWIW